RLAVLTGAQPPNVVFTSGGSEANAMGLAPARAGASAATARLLVSAIEHPSVLAGGRFSAKAVQHLPVTAAGQIDPAALEQHLRTGPRALVSVMLANNETGVVQPVPELARLVHEAGGLLHVDAVQGVGRTNLNINEL